MLSTHSLIYNIRWENYSFECGSQAAQRICGSFCYSCYKTEKHVQGTSSGQTGKRASSNLLIQKPSQNCGVCTKINQTWTMKQWAGLWGK